MLENTLVGFEKTAQMYIDKLPGFGKNYLHTEIGQIESALEHAATMRPYQRTQKWHDQYRTEVVQPIVSAGVQGVNKVYDLYERVTRIPVVGNVIDVLVRGYLLFRYGSGHIPQRSTMVQAVEGMGSLAENELSDSSEYTNPLWGYVSGIVGRFFGGNSKKGRSSESSGGSSELYTALQEVIRVINELTIPQTS